MASIASPKKKTPHYPFLIEETVWDFAPIARKRSIAESVELELNRIGYQSMDVRCTCDDQTIWLTGTVTRFYHLQVAIESARKFAEGRRIDQSIKVIGR